MTNYPVVAKIESRYCSFCYFYAVRTTPEPQSMCVDKHGDIHDQLGKRGGKLEYIFIHI